MLEPTLSRKWQLPSDSDDGSVVRTVMMAQWLGDSDDGSLVRIVMMYHLFGTLNALP